MTTTTIPLSAIPAQTFTAAVNGQPIQFWIRQLSTGLYTDIAMNGVDVALGVLAQDGVPIILDPTSPVKSDFVWVDTSGAGEDPSFEGLGARFVLQVVNQA